MPTAPHRPEPGPEALEWVRRAGWPETPIEPLSGDVSPRRYYRLRGCDRSAILVTYPRAVAEACARFAAASELLRGQGVRVPEILATDCDAGFMLVEDLGAETLYDRRQRGWIYLGEHLDRARGIIERIGGIEPERVSRLNPPLDAELFAAELANTWKLALGVADLAEAGLPKALETALASMLERLGEAPRAPCHRDFMARNLVPLDDSADLAVLDYQDLRMGPHTYDLASLLNDSLYPPEEIEESILKYCLKSPADRLDYHRSAAQRTLKIVGTFVGFSRRGFPRHLPLVEPTLARARRHLRSLPELGAAGAAVDELANALLASLARDE